MLSESRPGGYIYDAVFIDRDGTLNVKADEGEYITNPADLVLLPGAADAVRTLNEISRHVVVVTNQRGVALGRMTLDDVRSVNAHLEGLLQGKGGIIDAFYVCPHEIGQCQCRKPAIGMLLQARRDFTSIRFDKCALVGDSDSDMEAARRAGMLGVRLRAPHSGTHGRTPWDEVIEALRMSRPL